MSTTMGVEELKKRNAYLEQYFEEVSPELFYLDMFGDDFQEKGKAEKGKANGIIVIKEGDKFRRLFLDSKLEAIKEAQGKEFAITSPVSYFGKARTAQNSRYCYGIAIDLDGMTEDNMLDFFFQMGNEVIPKPTYIVSSGNGFHVYYLFKHKIPCYNHLKPKLKDFKKALTERVWNKYTSSEDSIQIQGIFQGFRIVGSCTKYGKDYLVRAFEIGEKVDIEYLNTFILPEFRIHNLNYESSTSLSDAKNLYPEWYERRIVQNQPKKTWTNHVALYNWWFEKIKFEASQGHRYFCIMCLAVYAKKCDVPFEKLEEDAYSLLTIMNVLGREPFTGDDIESALQAYNDCYKTFPIHTIVDLTDIYIQRNKRNGRSQSQHIKIMNAIRDIEFPNGSWRDGSGRKSKESIVKEWRANNPNGKKAQCIRETGLTKPTVYKWW